MAKDRGEQKPIVVDGTPIADSVDFLMDGDERLCTIVMSPALALEPIKVTMSFALIKQTAAQILIFEVGQEEERLKKLGQQIPIGLQHKRASAQNILREASAEIAAVAEARDAARRGPDKQVPGFGV